MDALRILIVDDEDELVSALEERLYLRGFQAKGVTSGEAALAYLADGQCDVVLLDVKMPGLSGLEVIKRIKEKTPSPQVILLTGHSSVQDAERGMGLGAFDYLMKPIKIDELISVLRSAGAGKGTGDAGEA
jgi:two-component system OmpR family response regulator